MLGIVEDRALSRVLAFGSALNSAPEWVTEANRDWPGLAGFPTPTQNDIAQSLNLNDHLIRSPESTFLLRVTGEALAGAGLHDGDLLVMDRATAPLAGSVALLGVEGNCVLAVLGRDAEGRLRMQAAGSTPDRPLDETMTLVGVARWVIHRLWPQRFSS